MINPDIKFNPIFSAQQIITLDADHKHMRNVVKLEHVRRTPPTNTEKSGYACSCLMGF